MAYDSIFLLSSGRVTSIGPRGQFNWQTDTEADWDFATDTIFSNNESPVGGAGGGDEERERKSLYLLVKHSDHQYQVSHLNHMGKRYIIMYTCTCN